MPRKKPLLKVVLRPDENGLAVYSTEAWELFQKTGGGPHTYLGANYGSARDLALNLEVADYPDLARYVRRHLGPDEKAAWIRDVEVDPKKRGRGLGSLLMRTALKELRKLGVRHVYVHYVAPGIHNWASRFGFETIGPKDRLMAAAVTLS